MEDPNTCASPSKSRQRIDGDSGSKGWCRRRVSINLSIPIWALLLLIFFIVQNVDLYFDGWYSKSGGVGEAMRMRGSSRGGTVSSIQSFSSLDDTSNIGLPANKDGTAMTTEERLRYLELKANAFMNFGSDPFFGSKVASQCRNTSDLTEFGCLPGSDGYPGCPGRFDHWICLDRFKKQRKKSLKKKEMPPCLVYDFGVRDMPQFGETMARTFGCEVHAFDPSPVSRKWWDGPRAQALRDLPNYHFHPYGAGGKDGDLTLMEYDWDQVSILHYPQLLVDCKEKKKGESGNSGNCKLRSTGNQKSFNLPVKTLPTILKELGHEGRTIDILKVDVEGSEYSFLENLLDSTGGCPDFIEQLALEWHHFPFDVKYGEGSSPPINAIVTLLHSCGLKMFWQHSQGGWRSPEKIYVDLDMKDVRYNLASFHREH